jgi:hypothetical protein
MDMRKSVTLVGLALGLVAAIGQAAWAQPTKRVAESRVEVGSWVYHGVYTSGVGEATINVNDVVAFAAPGSVVGENIAAVWYHWDGTQWATQSWLTQDMAEIVKSLSAQLGLDEAEQNNFAIGAVASSTISGAPESPKTYEQGLLAHACCDFGRS